MKARIPTVAAAALASLAACHSTDPRGDAPAARTVPTNEQHPPPSPPTKAPPPTPPPAQPEPFEPVLAPGAEGTGTAIPEQVLAPPAEDMHAPATYAVELTMTQGSDCD